MRTVLSASLLVLTLVACGGSGSDTAQPMADVDGLAVVVSGGTPFTRAPDFVPRVESTIQAALDYWGGSWADLRGRTLTFTDAAAVSCSGQAALGCFDGDLRVSTQDPGIGTFACLEQTVLVHEIGHAVIGDPDHRDPRWMELEPVLQKLGGRVGYTPDGVVDPCVLYLSVWRHPLGTP